jgi:uncharacterized protein DUF4164
MTDASAVETASRRLVQALDALEAALERRREVDRGGEALGAQLQALSVDRSRLAADLDSEMARARRIESASHEIARRLDVAIDTVRSVIDTHHH